jgi:hypothetical protein
MRWCSVLLLGLAACGTNEGDDDAAVDCAKVTGVDTFVVGLEKAGGSGVYNFRLMSAAPAPPARGDNTWIVQVNAMNAGVVGAPIDGAMIKVTPFMPAHQHGAGKMATIMPMTEPGQYELGEVNLWMPGVWETTIRATVGASTDSTIYKFCID